MLAAGSSARLSGAPRLPRALRPSLPGTPAVPSPRHQPLQLSKLPVGLAAAAATLPTTAAAAALPTTSSAAHFCCKRCSVARRGKEVAEKAGCCGLLASSELQHSVTIGDLMLDKNSAFGSKMALTGPQSANLSEACAAAPAVHHPPSRRPPSYNEPPSAPFPVSSLLCCPSPDLPRAATA